MRKSELTVEYLEKNNLIIFRAYRGSKAFGTFIEDKSDLDEIIIYMNPFKMLIGLKEPEQVNEKNNDVVGYELGRFMELLLKSNPTVCETLWTPDDCILYKHPIMDRIIAVRDTFLSKAMKKTFGGYAVQQISKASGTDKKINMKKDEVKRADVLNFVYTSFGQGSILIEKWLELKGLKQEYCGLVKIPHMRDTYGLYYDYAQHLQFEKPKYDSDEYWDLVINLDEPNPTSNWYKEFLSSFKNLKYKGIVKDKIKSNSVSLSEVSKHAVPLITVQFNKDGYTTACKDYKDYLHWDANHNEERFVDVQKHGQTTKSGNKIDGKNMLHCTRILNMALEIATGKGLNVRRDDAKYLIDIRHGVYDLNEILANCESLKVKMEEAFDNAEHLPNDVDRDYVNNMLISMREEFYEL